jgi:hypothetical protein
MHVIEYINLLDLHLSEDRSYLFGTISSELPSCGATVYGVSLVLLGDDSVLYLIVQLRHHLLMLLC